MAVYTVRLPPLVGPRVGRLIGIAVIGALALWPLAYVTGVFPWLGYAWLSRSSIGVGPGHFIVGESRYGTSLGLSWFPYAKGQTIVVSYDAEIARGCLWLQVWHVWHRGRDSSVHRCITESGRGEWRVTVAETGLYVVIINSSPTKGAGRGWEMSYTVWWGATW